MKETSYSKKVADLIKNFLSMDHWKYSFDAERGVFRFRLNLSGKIKSISYLVELKDDGYIVYSYSPIGVDRKNETKIARMAEFICRVNYGLKNGNFELDVRDGEVRYKIFVDCNGVLPSDSIIKTSIYCPAMMFDWYGSGIADIIFDDISAKEALDRCEKRSCEELRTLLSSEVTEASEVCDILERLAAYLSDTNCGGTTDTCSEMTA